MAGRLWRTGSAAVVPGPSGSKACGIFLDQGWKPVSAALAGGLFTVLHQGSPRAPSLGVEHMSQGSISENRTGACET